MCGYKMQGQVQQLEGQPDYTYCIYLIIAISLLPAYHDELSLEENAYECMKDITGEVISDFLPVKCLNSIN